MLSSCVRRMSVSSPFEFALILVALLLLAAFSQISHDKTAAAAMSDNEQQDQNNEDNSGYRFKEKDLSRGKQFFLEKDGEPVSYSKVLELLRDSDESFTTAFVNVLKNSVSDYSAYFFETPGTTLKAAKDHQFEFILNDASRYKNTKYD